MSSQLLTDTVPAAMFSETIAVQTSGNAPAARLVDSLRRWFGVVFAVVDGNSGEVISRPDELANCNWAVWGPLCRTVADRGKAEVIADEDSLYALAIPYSEPHADPLVAAAVFPATAPKSLATESVRQVVGGALDQAQAWLANREPLPAELALRLAARFLEAHVAEQRVRQLEREVEDLSINLSSTYEEISLLYRLTQNLKLSSNDDELGRMALEWLADVVPAESLAIYLTAVTTNDSSDTEGRTAATLLMHGTSPVNCAQFTQLVQRLGADDLQHPLILHGAELAAADDAATGIRELCLVPLCEGQNIFGYLAAFNHSEGRDFGTVEASLLNSVAAILGIHSGNIELYRQQREFLRGVVRALTSAIDAKDPYTCGHSDRVARVAVRLAEELGCDAETLNAIYLSGLLHDIGKIGIDDNVLRKPGKLTEIEYEHIKLHSEIGFRILKDLRQLDEVLPVVLHHHEQWDGKGYPKQLAGGNIPLMARIVAVADAFDAMGSDRPYRQGMPEARLDQVLREGAGKQWDPEVIDAFFRARDDIRIIFRRDREPQREVAQWL
jgi:putative nucleotidyltransferase with HDIG domain